MKVKLNEPEKRYGAIYVCCDQHIGKQPLKSVEMIEWVDTLDELKEIEPIYREWHNSIHESKKNRNRENPDVLYGISGYIVVDYQEQKIIKRVGFGIPYFSEAPMGKLRLFDNLFTSDEMREKVKKMSTGEYVGWLRFKYGDGLNAIHDDGRKPVDTKDMYEEYLKHDWRELKNADRYIDEEVCEHRQRKKIFSHD